MSIQSFHEKLTEIPSCTADECCSQQTRVQTTLPPYSETLLLSDACSESIATACYPTCQVISDSHSPPTNFPRQIFTLFPAHPIPPIPFASFLSQFLPESRCSLRSLPRSVRHRCPSSKLTHRNRLPLSVSLGVSSLKTLCTLVSY